MEKYMNSGLSSEERAKDLLSRLSFKEKIAQLVGYNPAHWSEDSLEKDYSDGVGQVSLLVATEKKSIYEVANLQKKLQERIMALTPYKIPALFHVETLTGVKAPNLTSFPSGIGQASTFNPSIQENIGEVLSEQVVSIGGNLAFSPVLDISRDSRFGRTGETYGEDPTVASVMGTYLVRGMQKSGYVGAVAKHFLGYQKSEGGIHAAECEISQRTLREVYAKPFQSAISQANLQGIMPCYSAINNEPVTGSKSILNRLLQEEMGFNGLIVSDYGAVREIYERQLVENSYGHAGRRALEAGVHQELPSKKCFTYENFSEWEEDSKFNDFINIAVYKVLKLKFDLKLFEKPFSSTEKVIKKCVEKEEHKKISLTSAKESIVLIKPESVKPKLKKCHFPWYNKGNK